MWRIEAALLAMLALGCGKPPANDQADPQPDASQPSPEASPEVRPEEDRPPELSASEREALAADHAQAIAQTRERLLAEAKLEPGMIVADIGASRGWFVDKAALAVGPEGTIYATDIDPEAIASLREMAGFDNPARGRIDVRACEGERDTGLRDLPDDHVDVISMVDSLCFDGSFTREEDVAYLEEFRRILKPGGRLVHHMDCECQPEVASVIERFEAAGFTTTERHPDLPQPPPGDPDWSCTSDAQRERHTLVLEFVG